MSANDNPPKTGLGKGLTTQARLAQAKVVASKTIKIQMRSKPSLTRALLSTPVPKHERRSPGMVQSREMHSASAESMEMTSDRQVPNDYDTIQDRYTIIRFKYEAWRIRRLGNQKAPIVPERESILYYKMGDVFIRPMGLFNGAPETEFSFIMPYSLRRGNGEIGILPFLYHENILVVDRHYITRIASSQTTITNTVVEPQESGKVYVFGEAYRGLRFGHPSFLEFKGQLLMLWHQEKGLPLEEPIRSHCVISVLQGSLGVFICEYKNIVLVADGNCVMSIGLPSTDINGPRSESYKAVQITGKDLLARSVKNPLQGLLDHIRQLRAEWERKRETETAPPPQEPLGKFAFSQGARPQGPITRPAFSQGGPSQGSSTRPAAYPHSFPTPSQVVPRSPFPQAIPAQGQALSKKYNTKFFIGGQTKLPENSQNIKLINSPVPENLKGANKYRVREKVTITNPDKTTRVCEKSYFLLNEGSTRALDAKGLIKKLQMDYLKQFNATGKIPLMSEKLPPGADKFPPRTN